ncbi:MAG: hypothetical protein IJ877_04285 [Candidatus Gastranaerophilales bacterium]|nr:hypothetical protein [Candidatus Gastranaerophilales bacterium]
MDFIFYIAIACFIMLFGTLDNNIDFDFFARLVVGKSYFQTGNLFNYDFQSYGTTHQFIDHEWGSSLIFYLVQNYLGDKGLFFLKSAIIFLTIFLITKIIRLEKKDIKLHFLFFFFILQTISYSIFSTIRCQSFSFLFFVLYLYILKKAKTDYRILWTLPVLNIIWANMHGGFVMGLILILLFAFGELLNKKPSRPYFITFFISCFTTLINPYGFKYIYFIFNALSLNRIHITEWQSAFFSPIFEFSFLKFKIFFILALTIFICSVLKNIQLQGIKEFYKNIDKTKYLILIFTIIIALKSSRFHVFFAYMTLSLCYCDFYNIFNKKLPKKTDNIKEILIAILIFISTISHIYDYKFVNTINSKEYPIYCIEFLKINNLKGNLLVNFHFGSYASYKLYPNIFIYMDGRYEEVYDVKLIDKMGEFFLAKNDDLIKKYHTDFIIIDKFYPLYKKLKTSSDWFLGYESEKFALFLDKKFQNKNYINPRLDKNYYNNEKFKTEINWR